MTTVAQNKEFQVQFNGSKTYMVIDKADQCVFATQSKTKAINRFKKVSYCAGL